MNLGDLVSISKGKKHFPVQNGHYRYINIDDLHNPSNAVFTNDRGVFVVEEDLIIAWDGANAGKVGVGFNGVIGSTLARLKIESAHVFPRYLFWFLDSINEKIKAQRTGATIPHVNGSALKSLEIPLPPLPVQQRIAAILDAADALRRKDQELMKKYDELAQAIFIDMFGDPERDDGYNELRTLNEVCLKITDGTHHTPKYTEEGIPFLRVTDITKSNDSKKYISVGEHLNLIKRCNPEKGDVLYTKNGTIGVARHVDWDYEFSIFVSLCLIKPKKDLLLPQYLESFLNMPMALKQATKYSKTGTITNLHLVEIKNIRIPLPELKKQEEYVERIGVIKKLKANLSSISDDLFDILLQKAFQGELVA